MPVTAQERIYTVGEITSLIKTTLEDGFPWISVQGEISNFRPSSTGHWYFSLKDAEAVISVVMFRGRLDGVRFAPVDGMLVKATGSVSVYARRGNYQLICESLIKAGEGDILAMLEARKQKLAAEGLFDLDRKKPLPLFPATVAVVTSPTGAAIRDILRILRRRNAGIDVVILPTPVQGDGADERIARAIEIANTHRLGDVIIVGRGGGSLEDLMPFSSEVVVRAIAGSRIPVISAVGHETDVTLSDLVADVRAPTPSAAAEIVAASRVELISRVRGLPVGVEKAIYASAWRGSGCSWTSSRRRASRGTSAYSSSLSRSGRTTRGMSSSRGTGTCVRERGHRWSSRLGSSPRIRRLPSLPGATPSSRMSRRGRSCCPRKK